jgi:acyl carrier protein
MIDQPAILQAIYRAVDSINEQSDPEKQIVKAVETALYGANSVLDSLRLVSLVVAVEREIEQESGVSLVLASERAMSQRRSPFLSIGSLAEYIEQLLSETVPPQGQ